MKKPNLTKLFVFLLISSLLIFLSVFEDWLEETFLTLILVTVAQGTLILALVRQEFKRNKWLELAILLLFSVFLLSTIFSKVHFWSLLYLLRWLAICEIFYINFGLLEKEQVQTAVTVIMIAATIAAIWGLYEFLYSAKPIEARRLYGALHTHVWTAGYFLLMIPIPLLKFLYEKNRIKKVLWGGLFSLFLLVLILTYARGAWISLVPVIFVLLLISRKAFWRNKFSFAFLLGLVLVVVLSISSTDLLLGRAKSLLYFYSPKKAASVQSSLSFDTGFFHRTNNYKNAVRIIGDNPLLGVGLSNFGWIYHQYQDQPWIFSRYAHSSFLDILTETGILGFLAFLIFLGVIFIATGKNLKEAIIRPEENLLALGILGGISASLLHNLIESDYHLSVILMMFIVELALFVVLLRGVHTEVKIGFNRLEKVVLSFLAILSLIMAFSLRMGVYNYQAYRRAAQKGNVELAKSYAFHSISWVPFYPFAYEALGVISLDEEKLSEALEYFKTAEELNPLYPENSFNVGYVQSRLGLVSDAEESFKKTLRIGPYTTPRYYNALGQFYVQNDKDEQAKQTYQQAIKHFPYNSIFLSYAFMYNLMKNHILESYISLAEIHLYNNETQKAKALFMEALKFDPENQNILEMIEDMESKIDAQK